MQYILALLLALGALIIQHAPQLAGVILPPFIQLLNKDVPDSRTRFIISVCTCIITATVINWHKIMIGTPDTFYTSTLLIFIESEAVYRLYFKRSWLQAKLQGTKKEETGESEILPTKP
jgi:hypothetical protein